jgi:hypothetical protein
MTINPKRVTRLGTKKRSNIATSSQRAADSRRIKEALMGGFRKPRTAIVGDGNGNVDAVAISGAPNTIYFKYPSDVTDEQRWAYTDWAQNDERFVHGTVILVEPSHENPREMVVRGYDPLRTKYQHEVRPNFREPSAAFTHTFDFEVAHECWVPNNSATHYVPLNGWDVSSGDTLYLKKMGFESFILTSIQTVWQNAWASFPGAGGGVFIYDQDGTLLGSEDAFPVAGVDLTIDNYEVTGIKVQAVRTGPGTETGLVDAYLSSIIISGIGINPFEDEICPDTLPIQSLTGVATTGQLPSDIVYLTSTQTLTNKTLTSPAVNTPVIAGGTANSLVIGGTTAAAGRFTALALNAATELTLATDIITVTQSYHRIDTEGDAGTDDLITINGGSGTLNRLVIRAENAARTVIVRTSGNITTPDGQDITLDDTNKVLELVYDATLTKWQVVGRASDIDAASVPYSPSVPSDYNSTPAYVAPALDEIVSRVELLEGGGGGPISGITPSHCDLRLTLESGVAISTTDQGSKATLYLTPYKGAIIALYDGSSWSGYPTSQISLSLAGLDRHRLYDIWCYLNAGSPTLDYTAWTAPTTGTITTVTNASPPVVTSAAHGLAVNDIVTIHDVGGATGVNTTSRISAVTTDTFTLQSLDAVNLSAPGVYTSGGTWVKKYSGTSRTTPLTTQNGIYVKTGDATRRYVGTICVNDAGGQTDDTVLERLVFSYVNHKAQHLYVVDATASWTYGTAAWRATRNSFANRLDFVLGVAEYMIEGVATQITSTSGSVGAGVGVDQITTSDAQVGDWAAVTTNMAGTARAVYKGYPSAGLHYVQRMEFNHGGTGTMTGTQTGGRSSGLTAMIEA